MRAGACALAAALASLGCPATDTARESQTAPEAAAHSGGDWSPAQIQLLESLSIASLPALPAAPSNRVADDPRALRLGDRLFFEPGLSANGEISCATCHLPALYFSDGRPRSVGLAETPRNAPTVVGLAYSPWLFWDGRRDSLWAQALAPMEAPPEMGATRLDVVRFVTGDPRYRAAYVEIFGEPPDFAAAPFPVRASPYGDREARAAWEALDPDRQDEVNRAFANIGKAIAAYERRLVPGPSRFDVYVAALVEGKLGPGEQGPLSGDEIAGLRLFVDAGRTQCLRCHNGPLLTNNSFHDIATSRFGPLPDLGRFLGAQSLLLDEFNCLGRYSDAPAEACEELRFLGRRELGEKAGAFKTPTLRGVAETAPYLHDGSMATLEEVMDHYRDPPPEPGHELPTLDLSDAEAAQLVAFLKALSGGVAAEPVWLAPPSS
jgi:cytochrome c peroxidase